MNCKRTNYRRPSRVIVSTFDAMRWFEPRAVIAAILTVATPMFFIFVIGASAAFAQPSDSKPRDWISLFDGKSLAGWKPTEFGGEGAVSVNAGAILLPMGSPMTGVTYRGAVDLPTTDYELCLQARRNDGTDFFCGVTFPYKTSHCSFILGGWGGGLVGLSSLDDMDASENETTSYMNFKKGQWYAVRVKVREGGIYCWIDDKQVVACAVRGRRVGTRPEITRSKPLGIASFETTAEIRDVKLRRLTRDESTARR